MSEVNEAYPPPPCSASVPDWVAEEIKTTWQAARDAGGEMQAFRIIERMVDRLGYGRMKNNPSLVPNPSVLLPPLGGGSVAPGCCVSESDRRNP